MADLKRLALVGYGKMGQMIERLTPAQGFEVVLRLDEHNNAGGSGINSQNFGNVDVAIEFSNPEVAPENLKRLAETGVDAVTGTTGWLDSLGEVTETVQKAGTGLVWADVWPLLIIAVAATPIGLAIFHRGEVHAKKHGKLKRSG